MKLRYFRRPARSTLAALAALGLGSSVRAENPPPCDPCTVTFPPTALPSDITAQVGAAQKVGLKGWRIPVTWSTIDVPRGAYLPECANNNGNSEQAFEGWYVPTQKTKYFYLTTGASRFTMSDNFYARYFDPCHEGPFKIGGTAYGLVSIKAPIQDDPPPPPDDPPPPPPDDPPPPPPDDPPPPEDPYQDKTETKDPCPPPFQPGQCSPFNHTDTRVSMDLAEPQQVEIVAENISFQQGKHGFLQYNADSIAIPVPKKYFIQEDATTSLDGGTPESPVGGTITRRICSMTGELIETAKSGNPSFYGVRSGPNVTLTETTASGSISVLSYDDCPNLEDDAPGILNFSSVLSIEYTKELMRNDACDYAWDFKGDGYFRHEAAYAALLVNEMEDVAFYQKTKYKIRAPKSVPRPYKVTWVEEFTPKDDNVYDETIPEKEYLFKNTTIYDAPSDTGAQSESDTYTIDPKSDPTKEGSWRVYLLKVDACVDANRDLAIDLGGSDHTNPTKRHRFWINDDRDILHQVDPLPPPVGHGGILEEDDVQSDEKSSADCDDLGLLYLRDLEDLDRIHVDYSSLMPGINVESITIKARMETVEGNPSINLFTAVELDGGLQYLFGAVGETGDTYPPSGKAGEQLLSGFGSILASVSPGSDVIINDINREARGNYRMALLYEGKSPGKGNLYFDFYLEGEKIASSNAIHLDLNPVEDMYETWTVGDVVGGGSNYDVWPFPIAYHTRGKNIPEPETTAEREYTLFVHGWNVPTWEKTKAFGNTQYKRMWQSGYKGRFGIFTWPTFHGNPGATDFFDHFNGSEERAWNSAKGLKQVIEDRSANGFRVYLNGHSMGNIVCGEALRLFEGVAPVRKYISAQAALSAHTWDPTTKMIVDSDPEMPDVYAYFWKNGSNSTNVTGWAINWNPSYHASNYHNTGVEYINHWNRDDWALKNWEVNTRLKPALPKYGYNVDTGIFDRENSTLTFPDNRYEVFSWAAQSHSYATGAEGKTDGVFNTQRSYDMTGYFGDLHPGHSAQWRSTIQRRFEYWEIFIEHMDYEN